MIRVKFFPGNSTNYNKLEKDINDWLTEKQRQGGYFSIMSIEFIKDTGDREVMILYDDSSNGYCVDSSSGYCVAEYENFDEEEEE